MCNLILGKDVQFTEKLSGKEDYLSLLEIFLIMSFNTILYSLLTWYLEQVTPSKFGIPKPYGFCFKVHCVKVLLF